MRKPLRAAAASAAPASTGASMSSMQLFAAAYVGGSRAGGVMVAAVGFIVGHA